jgi:hypothetical protein
VGGRGTRTAPRLVALLSSACALAPASAGAHTAVAVPDVAGDSIVSFDTANPAAFTSQVPVTGLAAGERIVGVDYRHAPDPASGAAPRLFAVAVDGNGAGLNARLYTIDPGTGAASVVGTGAAIPILPSATGAYGVDFNPAADRLRVVNSSDENMRINPNLGVRADFPTNDNDLNPASNGIAAAAYSRVSTAFIPPPPAQPTTLFALNPANDMLVRVGGLDGAIPSPNTGQIFNVGALTVAAEPGPTQNLDIALDGTAFATMSVAAVSGLYTVDPAGGAATLVGTLANPVRAFALLPDSSAQLSVDAVTLDEGGTATFTVTRTGSLASTQSVGFQTTAVSAADSDFTPASGRLTFAPDESARTFEVATTKDSVDEPDETVAIELAAPDALMSLGAPSTALLTITDGDRTRPSVKVRGLKRKMPLEAFLKGLKLRLIPDEAVRFKLTLLSLGGGGKRVRAAAPLAVKRLKLAEGRRNVELKPNAKRVGKPERAFRAMLRIVATDAAGNQRKIQRTINVKP